MYVKKLIIDGFKSYGTRTEIKGFDPEFNAITGLNGTGKSNILDSICFVLGISNLTNVRAQNVVDLIYKSGQAGVTKATVTIIFDNSDPTKSPLNYEHQKEITVSRQIIVGGKNRYTINGNVVNNKSIFDFFKSVQLNVNNPHFLIMQGRITKVLNMKPPEILSMIEEAAGTSMYEHKKQVAQKTVEKKDTKLKEMESMVTEQINPKMQRLKDERDQYFQYQRIQKEYESLTRINTAFNYYNLEKNIEKIEHKKDKLLNDKKALQDKKVKAEERIKTLEVEINELNSKIDADKGGILSELQAEVKSLEQTEAKTSAEYKNMESTINSEMKKKKMLMKSLADDERDFAAKKAVMDKAGSVFNELKEAQKNDEEALIAAQKKLEAVEQGKLSNEDGEDASLQDQLIAANEQLKEAELEVKMSTMHIDHLQKELKTKQPQLKQTESSFHNDSKELSDKERELANLKNQLKKKNYVEGQSERLDDQLRAVNNAVRSCNDTVNQLGHRYPHLKFTYTDPEPNFNKKTVRGLLCRLFKVKEERFARALETVAGGKLYNVVVDNELVSSKLIKNGNLSKRTTFVPINKIQGYKMNPDLLKKAQRLVGPNNVFCAQDLIEYDKEYETIMAWAFGQTFICTDSDLALRICEAKDINRKAVTLDGDTFDPAGVIAGGAVAKSDPILTTLIELMNAEKNLHLKQKEFETLSRQKDSLREVALLDKSAKTLEAEIEMIKSRVQNSAHYQLKQEIEELQQKIDEKSKRKVEADKVIKEKSKKVKELKDQMKNLESIRSNALKSAKQELAKAEKRAEESKNNWMKREQEYEVLRLEIEELQKSVAVCNQDLEKSEETIATNKSLSAEIKVTLSDIQEKIKKKKAEVKVQEQEIYKKNSEIKSLVDKKEKLIQQISDMGVEETSFDIEHSKLLETIKDCYNTRVKMEKDHKWIESDKEYFGQPNGLYDFDKVKAEEAGSKLRKLEQMKEKLSKLVNVKELDVLGTQEEQLQEVMNKKEIVEEDRNTILSVIGELDVKKEEVIRTAWDRVNTDFNSILSTLLPGFNAKLQPVQGKDFMDGLQIKVGLGGIWKESLDELSGGQRSLVALSLILAMLRFKPAPLYILDEVDAALDQSHTQNIGQMLKKHFRQSQFIVVSLKDGMFTNANVLFRTSFVDGMSQVIRTTPNQQH